MNIRNLDMADCTLLTFFVLGFIWIADREVDFMAMGGVMTITYTGLMISRTYSHG